MVDERENSGGSCLPHWPLPSELPLLLLGRFRQFKIEIRVSYKCKRSADAVHSIFLPRADLKTSITCADLKHIITLLDMPSRNGDAAALRVCAAATNPRQLSFACCSFAVDFALAK